MKRSRKSRGLHTDTARFEGFEALEPRLAMAVVHWTGDGDGVTLNNRYNWEHNNLPAHNDIAIIDVPGAARIEHNSGYFRAKDLLVFEELTIRGGTFDVGFLEGDVGGVINMEGGTFTGEGRLRINGLFNWTGGSIIGDGDIDVGSDGHFVLNSPTPLTLGRDVSSRGLIEWLGGNLEGTDGDGTFIINEREGDILAKGQGRFRSLNGPGYFDNRGLFVRTDAGATQFVVPVHNTGTINVAGGRLELFAGGTNAGVRNVAQGARLHYFGDFTHLAGSTLAGGGETIWQGGTHTMAADQSLGSYLYISNATVTGPGLWTITGVVGWSHGRLEGPGGTIIAPTGKIEIRTLGQHTLARDIENNGTLIWNRGPLSFEGATITNNQNRAFYLVAEATAVSAAGDNRIVNHGEMRKVLPTAMGFGDVLLDNRGHLNVRNGSLALNQGAVVQIADGTLSAGAWSVYGTANLDFSGAQVHTIGADATLTRTGALAGLAILHGLRENHGSITLTGGGTCEMTPEEGFINAGRIALGPSTSMSFGGVYTQTGTGILELGVSSPNALAAGRIIANFGAIVDGALGIRFSGGYLPAPGAQFRLLTASSLQGEFTLLELGGPIGELQHDPTGVVVNYV